MTLRHSTAAARTPTLLPLVAALSLVAAVSFAATDTASADVPARADVNAALDRVSVTRGTPGFRIDGTTVTITGQADKLEKRSVSRAVASVEGVERVVNLISAD